MENEPKNVELAVPASLGFSQVVRNIAGEIFSIAKFNKAWQARLKLVVDELFMNAVLYGSKEGVTKVHLQFLYTADEVSFSVEDEGAGEEQMSAEELQKKIQKNSENGDITKTSGRGLAMITSLWTDDIEITENSYGGIKVACRKKVEDTEPPRPPVPDSIAALKKEMAEEAKTPASPVQTGETISLSLEGEIDQSNIDDKTAQVEAQIKNADKGALIEIDFSKVNYINSTFIGHLAFWHNAMAKKGGKIRILKPNKEVKDILDLVGLGNVIEIS